MRSPLPTTLVPLALAAVVAAAVVAAAWWLHTTADDRVPAPIALPARAGAGGESPALPPDPAAGRVAARPDAPDWQADAVVDALPARARFAVCASPKAVLAWPGGTLSAESNGRLLARRAGVDLEFQVPAAATDVTFTAIGYRRVVRRVPAPGPVPLDFGEIVLEPDALLVLRLVDAPTTAAAGAAHEVLDAAGRVLASARGSQIVELPVPADTRIVLRSRVDHEGEPTLHLAPVPLLLGAGERRQLDVPCGEPTNVRLVGMSKDLLGHVHVEIAAAGSDGAPLVLRPDPQDRLRFTLPAATSRAWVRTFDAHRVVLAAADGTVDLPRGGGEVALGPAEPVVAVVVTRAGRVVPSMLALDTQEIEPVLRPGHVAARARLAAATDVHAWIDAGGDLTTPVDRLRTDRDVWVFDAEAAVHPPRGTLLVRIAGANSALARIGLVAEPTGGGRAERLVGRGNALAATLPPGDYRLRWRIRDGDGPAVGQVQVRADATTELEVDPLPLERWHVTLRGAGPTAPAAMVFVRLAGIESPTGWQAGAWLLELPGPPQVGDRGEVFLPAVRATFDATVVAVDAAGRHAVIDSPLAGAAWTRIAAPTGGKTSVVLQGGPTDAVLQPPFTTGDVAVPLLPGERRDGALVEHVDGGFQVTAWFRVEHGMQTLAPSGHGRWCTIRFERPFAAAHVAMQGPATLAPIAVRTLHAPVDLRVFVADGTREIVVDLVPGGRRALPADAASLVVL